MIHISILLPYGFSAATSMTLHETFRVSEFMKNPGPFSVSFDAPNRVMTSYLGTKHLISKDEKKKIDVLIITGCAGTSKEDVFRNLQKSEEWVLEKIRHARANGALLCSSCSGAYFLAKAGLLKKKKATTAWWLAPDFKKLFPDTDWALDEILIPVGKILTAGGLLSALELSSAIMTRFATLDTKLQTEKFLVLPPKRINQRSYKIHSLLDDPGITKALKFIRSNLETCCVKDLEDQLKMSKRTLYRFCHKNLSLSPYQWIREIRLDEAQKLLERTNLSVEEIGFKVGHADTSSFMKAFKKSFGVSPAQYRSKSIILS